jgi:RNA-splicing ligase RtcB
MKEYKGKFAKTKVFTDTADYETISQIKDLLNSHLSKDSKVRIMPDTHAGAGNVIGLTMTLNDKIAPSLIGSDIGCGISLVRFKTNKDIDLERFDEVVHTEIPYGYLKREYEVKNKGIYQSLKTLVLALKCSKELGQDHLYSVAKSGFATLGGGNHFIELYKYEDSYYLSIHTGSRTLGGLVYKYYQRKAKNLAYETFLQERQDIINTLKKNDREQEISHELEKHKNDYFKKYNVNKEIKYLMGKDKDDYLHDMGIVQEYARLNRIFIEQEIILNYDEYILVSNDRIDKPHNYVDLDRGILRKGSQSALKNEDVIIPINMRDGVIVGKGLGNEDWNYSAPHGAGRLLSRSQAKQQLNVEDFKNDMKNVYSTTVGQETLDEAPNAYKSIDEILENIKDNVEITKILKPIYNFKGGKEYVK